MRSKSRKRSKSRRRRRSKSRRKSTIVGATVPLAALLVGSLGGNLLQYSRSKSDKVVGDNAQMLNENAKLAEEAAKKEARHARMSAVGYRKRIAILEKENNALEKKLSSKLSNADINKMENRNVALNKEVELLRERLESQRNMPPVAPPRMNQQGVPVGGPPVALAMGQSVPPPPVGIAPPPAMAPPPPPMMAPPVVRASSAPMPRVSGKKRSRASRPKSMTLMEQLKQNRNLKSATARKLPPLRGPAGNPMAELRKKLKQRREYVAPVVDDDGDDDDDDWP